MASVLWSEPAVEQLLLIRKSSLRSRVYRAVGGLAKFPLRGRRPPEVSRFPDLELPADLRELVFPRVSRLFYLYDESKDVVRVLGMTFRGKEVGPDWFQHLLEQ